jgi:hypothetical protein
MLLPYIFSLMPFRFELFHISNLKIEQQGFRHATKRKKGRIPRRGIWDPLFTGDKGHAKGIAADR